MKKLAFLIFAVVFSTAAFAQQPQPQKSADNSAITNTGPTAVTHCYAMMSGAMIQCLYLKSGPMTADVTLKNGTIVTTSGQVVETNGTTTTLVDGQCVDLGGKILDFVTIHPDKQ